VLEPSQARRVLRYWLALVRHEEALSQRLRSGGRRRADAAWSWKEPDDEAPYLRLLPLSDHASALDFILRADRHLELPMSPAAYGLFAAWLVREWRSERRQKIGLADEDSRSPWVVGFPTVHFQSRGELAPLVRFVLSDVVPRDARGAAFSAPGWRARREGTWPDLPVAVSFVGETPEPDVLPFSVDTDLLSRVCGVQLEEALAWADAVSSGPDRSPLGMLRALIRLLRAPDSARKAALPSDDDLERLEPAEVFGALTEAVQTSLVAGGGRAWPVALIYPGDRIAATVHLQADLAAILQREEPLGRPGRPLHAYLAGAAAPLLRSVPRSLLSDRPLAAGQEEVLAHLGASGLVAAQGPPGTGKTHLVQHLIGEALVASVADRALRGRRAPDPLPLLVITSTNNRAVDQAIAPFSTHADPDRLPVALRAGNREVTATVTTALLARSLAWLDDPPEGVPSWMDARDDFRTAWEMLEEVRAPVARPLAVAQERAQLAQELELIEARVGGLRDRLGIVDGELAPRGSPSVLRAAATKLEELLDDLGHVIDIIESGGGSFASKGLRKRWGRLRGARIQRTVELLDLAGRPPRPLEAPPLPSKKAPDDAETWEALQGAVSHLEDEVSEELLAIEAQLQSADAQRGERATLASLESRAHTLRGRLAALDPDDEPDPAAVARLAELGPTLRHRLYQAAVAAREAWALEHRDELALALSEAQETLKRRKSLRPLLDGDPRMATALRGLFPAMGCTLLSLGNTLPPAPGVIDQLIIDEGGQCHPAYALSGLLRAERALVIGDVHQLDPVVQLDSHEERRILTRLEIDPDAPWLQPYRVASEPPASAQSLAQRASQRVLALRDHFRSQPPIIGLSDRLCGYGLRVHTPPDSLSTQCPLLDRPIVGVAVRGVQARHLGSWRNDEELVAVREILRRLLAADVAPGRVAVITPYRGQAEALRSALRADRIPIEDPLMLDHDTPDLLGHTGGSVALGTVHRFQGGERDVVVFSTVVTEARSLTFLNQRVNLVNVAVSRARMHLVVVGHPELLMQGDVTRALVDATRRP
jgi:hypothetical protein